jgi:hypothetical protein
MLKQVNWKWAVLLAVASSASAVGQDVSPPVPAPPTPPAPTSGSVPLRVTLAAEPQEGILYLADTESDAPPQSDYWIGIVLGELPEIAKQQLKLESGLVVEDVLPDSPAAKAEFKRFDVLLKAADQPLAEPADILKAVDQAKENELVIEAIRSGNRLKLRVVPAKRPKPEAGESAKIDVAASPELRATALKKLEEALAELKGVAGKESLELFFARPGVVATKVRSVELPKNMTLSITRSGNGPAKVFIKRDDQEWNTTEDKLFDLPPDVRVHVEQMLGGLMHPMIHHRAMTTVVRAPMAGVTARAPATAASPYAPGVAPPMVVLPQPAPAGTTARLHAYRVEKSGEAGDVAGKLELIIKKLDNLESKAIEQLQDEVKQLRKELDELRDK